MYDPHFEAVVAEIRGFDLGDGPQLLAQLDALGEAALDGAQWLLRGVLLHQAGRDEQALPCIQEAARRGTEPARALYLASCLLRRLGRAAEGRAVLEEARRAAVSDRSIDAVELEHALGLLLWSEGRTADALGQVDRAIGQDPGTAARWFHRGQLLAELGRPDEAAQAFERALSEEQDFDRAMYERAAVEVTRGRPELVAAWLTKAVHLEPRHREHARRDERFASVREHEALAPLLAPAHPADLQWLDALAAWMPALRRSAELSRLGITWLDHAESEAIGQGLRADHEHGPLGTMHTEATLSHSRELLATRVVVARGPATCTREGVEEPCLWLVDRSAPQRGLWLALSAAYPPFLWIHVDPRPAAIERVLGEFFPRPRRLRSDLFAVARGFVGYSSRFVVPSPYTGGLEAATIVELDRHFAINPFLESASWGSAYDDDPWPDELTDQPDLTHKIAARQRLVAEQARGHVWSLTRRTRHSRSYLSVEVHHDEIFVAQVRYRPSSHPEVIEAMNQHFGCDYPVDMPVDTVAALLGFQFDGAADLETQLDPEQPDRLAGLLYVISALRYDDPGSSSLYRRMLDHPDPTVRGTVAEIAVAYNLESLLEEMSLRETDDELRAEIVAVLDEGIPVPETDPYAELEASPEALVDAVSDAIEITDADVEDEAYLIDESDMIVDRPRPDGGRGGGKGA